jgi:hypothetical protein
MSVDVAQAKINKGIKDLRAQWGMVRSLWRDPVAQDFEDTFVLDLEKDVRATLAAMDHIKASVAAARRDCG